MITCPKCNKELQDGAKFCGGCGTQILAPDVCPSCGEARSGGGEFCRKCGAALPKMKAAEAPQTEPIKAQKSAPKPIPKKALMFGGIGVAVVAVAVLAVVLLMGGGSRENFGLYIKNQEIVYSDLSQKEPLEVTSRLMSGGETAGSEFSYMAYSMARYIAFSEDGNRIFFPDRVNESSSGMTLYYRDLNKPNADAVKVDSDVTDFRINKAGTCVIYLKGSGGDSILYRHNLKEKEKIGSGISSFNVANDCKKVSYFSTAGGYYLWNEGKESQKMASDVSSVEYISKDLSKVYYIKDGTLYSQTEGEKEKVKIASDVSSVAKVYESGEVYYTREDMAEKSLMDYVEDDAAAADAALTEPEYPTFPDYPDYPYSFEYNDKAQYDAAKAQYDANIEAYEAEYERLQNEYSAAEEAYSAKRSRDRIREDLALEKMEQTVYSLYYFDGKTETAVTDALVDRWSVTAARDSAALVLQIYNQSEVRKVKLSEVTNAYEVEDMVEAALYSSTEQYVAVGAALSVIDQTKAEAFRISDAGDAVYYVDDIGEKDYGELYKLSIKDKKAGTPELYDSDVGRYSVYLTPEGSLVYYKNMSDDGVKGDLFIDKKEIDTDVRVMGLPYESSDTSFMYFTDWNNEKRYGTLKMWKDGKAVKIADDVNTFTVTAKEEILYLYDYSMTSYQGDLYRYNNGKPQKLDDEVQGLIPVTLQKDRDGTE